MTPAPVSPLTVAARSAIGAGIGAVTLGLISIWVGEPFLLPPMGATAFLAFGAPHMAPSSPRNALLGSAIALLSGFLALQLSGHVHSAAALAMGFDSSRVFGCAGALAATTFLMLATASVHPPAGATTLVVSLGLIREQKHLFVAELAVGVLVVEAYLYHRTFGVNYPAWSAPKAARPQPAEQPSAN